MRPFDKAWFVFCLFAVTTCCVSLGHDAYVGDKKRIKKTVSALAVWTGFTAVAYRGLKAQSERYQAFVKGLEALPFDQALGVAAASSVRLPRELVQQKRAVPFTRWKAFERETFQFIMVEDPAGKCKVITI